MEYWHKVAVTAIQDEIIGLLKPKAVINLKRFITKNIGIEPTYSKVEYLAKKWLYNVYLA